MTHLREIRPSASGGATISDELGRTPMAEDFHLNILSIFAGRRSAPGLRTGHNVNALAVSTANLEVVKAPTIFLQE